MLNDIFDINFAINISISSNIFNKIANNFANLKEIKDINIVINPKIIVIPNIGLASKLEIKKVNETVLKLSAVIGIIIICAEIVIASNLLTFLFNFVLDNKFSTFLLNNTIPNVPKYDNCNPISVIAYGLNNKIIIKLKEILDIISDFL